MCPSIPIAAIYGAIGTDSWNASAYATLSVASKVSASVRAQGIILGLAREVWKLDGTLREFLDHIYKAVDNPPPPEPEPITSEQIIEAASTLRKIHTTIEQFYSRSKAAGLTNRRFVGAALNSVRVRAEELLDIGDALELSLNAEVDRRLERSLEDLRSGNVHDLPAFK